ncbi:3,4-dihydroxy-2-butanone-4-phosphate synthase [Frigidibacter sp. MR17.14]|uniref:3,4-dihydroxy-2-butanone-4-phosphate synthase n=1 Tax=Frigidibacter sp. MR17.14 TaxID=3126509 RepID=UPI003012D850
MTDPILPEDHYRDAISTTEEIIADARAGKMFILVDHEDRENEGDLVIPAEMANAEVVNFMATHGRGLICLPMESKRIDALNLPLMASKNSSRHETAFTVSIEAREGVETGISAADRALTIAVAIDDKTQPSDIATPGHIFPLRARDGGVLVRAGHTEASVDIARLAGKKPAGVICEIMNDDGTMARLPDLVKFAQKHGLKIGTISDLIAYRRRHDNLVTETAVKPVKSVHGGDWVMRIFTDATQGAEQIVLTKGDLSSPGPVAVRVHQLDPLEDVLGIGEGSDLAAAMRTIGTIGRGVIVLLRDTTMRLSVEGHASPHVLRQYGLGAQILATLGLKQITLVTNSEQPRVVGLEGYGLEIAGTHPITE